MINIVLFEPEIAGNTANIGRTVYLTNSRLHLIRPLGFSLRDKKMRRVGLDYWEKIDLVVHDSIEDFIKYSQGGNIYISTTKANKFYSQVEFQDGDYIIFGSESKGIDDDYLNANIDRTIKIPMRSDSDRSLNLANSVNIVLFEAYRQLDFINME